MKKYSGNAILFSSFHAKSVFGRFLAFHAKWVELNDKFGLIYI